MVKHGEGFLQDTDFFVFTRTSAHREKINVWLYFLMSASLVSNQEAVREDLAPVGNGQDLTKKAPPCKDQHFRSADFPDRFPTGARFASWASISTMLRVKKNHCFECGLNGGCRYLPTCSCFFDSSPLKSKSWSQS